MSETLVIVRDFHPFPGGRYLVDGPGNGTTFREKYLVPVLQKHGELTIDLDGAPGYPSSFLEEAFGGLIRQNFDVEAIRAALKFKATDPGYQRYITKIWGHIERAAAERVH